MKNILLLSLFPVFISSNNIKPIEPCYEEVSIELKRKNIQPITTDGELLSALIFVESRGNDSAIGDKHLVGNEAVGALQIRPIMVREVNRICKIIGSHQHFALKDRFDRNKSIHMFMIWKDYHHKNDSDETIARNWNGGPKGYKKDRTVKYWNKIEKQLNNE
jgi:hypothetical protein|tara:strand:- start:363 stop:848 length:486 start_codon:yes stop_codon:yes gene_type:complete